MPRSIALGSLLLIAGAMAAHAHASLANASPAVNSTVNASPDQVVLTFTEKLEPAFSQLTVTDANGVEVSNGGAQVTDAVMRIGLKPLSPGAYRVNWRAVSSDTHKMEGTFTFQVVP